MIDYTPSKTRCYCGSSESLEFCATCRDWLVVNSPRIVSFWRSWLDAWDGDRNERYKALLVRTHAPADRAEAYDLVDYFSRSCGNGSI